MDRFLQRKKDILEKKDKSFIGNWDLKVISLCKIINLSPDFYTTSSCSGRIILILDRDKKQKNLFLWVSHEKVGVKNFFLELDKIKMKDVRFKVEPFILHVACRNLDFSKEFLDLCSSVGFKAGLICVEKNFIVEVRGSQKIEFPIINNFEVLVDEKFIGIVLKKSNDILIKNWQKIKNLEIMFEKRFL